MSLPWRIGDEVARRDFAEIRRRAIFECDKWDPQVGDISTLAPYPIILSTRTWEELATLAERLAHETIEAETELLSRPDLWSQLGLSRQVRSALRGAVPANHPGESLRVMRFDFHYTTEGWKISEANTDVPGGYNEAAGFSSIMAEHASGCLLAGNPAVQLARAIRGHTPPGGLVGLVHATSYSDDRQVVRFLARHLEQEGLQTVSLAPDHVFWRNGEAWTCNDWRQGKLDFLYRFFPGEWLPNLPRNTGWSHFFRESLTPMLNPGSALLTQSKRFPLVWDCLETTLPYWRHLLPETRHPQQVPWGQESDWVLKPAWGRVGEMVGLPGVTGEAEWRLIRRSVFWHRRSWIAQRRFHSIPLSRDPGSIHPCFGVYTIWQKACGIYGRISPRPLIDHCAMDAAVLVKSELSMKAEPAASDRYLLPTPP